MTSAIKGRFTIRTAGVLFILSAILEIINLTSVVPLLGAVRSGIIANIYHLTFTAIYLGIGCGLLLARRWGYWAVFMGTALYTFDKVQLLLDQQTYMVYLFENMRGLNDILVGIDKGYLFQLIIITTITFIACWWGFALYIYLRRDYFH